jgi:hypothetical protein
MSQFPNKIGLHNSNKMDEISEVVYDSLKIKLSHISSESSKIVIERLQPLIYSNKAELNSIGDQLSKLKNTYKFVEKDHKPINFKNKSNELTQGIKKLKRKINQDNELIQSPQEISLNDQNVTHNFNQCLNNLNSVSQINSGKYRTNSVSEFSDKLSELFNYFLSQTKSLESAVSSNFDNGLSQREELKEKLKRTLLKLDEIKLYFNQKKKIENENFILEKEYFNFLNLNQIDPQSQTPQRTQVSYFNNNNNNEFNPIPNSLPKVSSSSIDFFKFSPEEIEFL